MLRAKVDGLSIAYQRAGGGPPLVLLHGFTHDSRVWRPQLESLADRFTKRGSGARRCIAARLEGGVGRGPRRSQRRGVRGLTNKISITPHVQSYAAVELRPEESRRALEILVRSLSSGGYRRWR